MNWNEFDLEQKFREAWESVTIEREVHYSLFTFGDSDLSYFLVCGPTQKGKNVSVTQGEVHVERPRIITPGMDRPEFRNFFDDPEHEGMVDFLLARTAAFSNLRFDNRAGEERIVSDNIEEAVDKLNRQLDDEEEDRVAILSAPRELAGIAILRYASERVWSSTPDNLQELRERGFLP